jgi:hypothetical protein
MAMLKEEDSKTMRRVGFNFVLLAVLMLALIVISLYFS